MLTTRAQRFWMFCIGFCALLLGIVVVIPFKSVFEHENLFLIEALCKLIFVPILVILLFVVYILSFVCIYNLIKNKIATKKGHTFDQISKKSLLSE